jgi:hypothetical protein
MWPTIRPGLTFHELRHSHKTWLITAGIPEIAQARRLGHHLDKRVIEVHSHVADQVETRIQTTLKQAWLDARHTITDHPTPPPVTPRNGYCIRRHLPDHDKLPAPHKHHHGRQRSHTRAQDPDQHKHTQPPADQRSDVEQPAPHPPHIRSNPHLRTINEDQPHNNKMAVDLVI